MNTSRILVVAISVACTSSHVSAQELRPEALSPCPIQAMVAAGDELLTILPQPQERLLKILPIPSPKEVEWLRVELTSGDWNRSYSAEKSTIAAQLRLRDITEKRLALLRSIQTGNLDPAEEALAWGRVAGTFHDPDFANGLFRLVDANVINRSFLPKPRSRSSEVLDFDIGCQNIGSNILSKIILPYLEQEVARQ